MPPTRNAPPAIAQACEAGSPAAAALRYTARALEVVPALFMRRTKVQPAGAVTAAPELVNPTAAIITSPEMVPAGVEIVRFTLAGRSARMCAVPASAKPAAVAV